LGRIAAQTARQVMMQDFRETERERVFDEFNEKIGEVTTAIVERKDGQNVYVNIGKLPAMLPFHEQVPTETYRFNDRIKVYLLEVRKLGRGPALIVSRSHPSLIRRLFELEVPEIGDGTVVIKSVAREAGARSKIAVHADDPKIDPVGACVGHRGGRVQAVVGELFDEKIDIIRWSDNVAQFVAESLSPAKVSTVEVNEDKKSCFVLVEVPKRLLREPQPNQRRIKSLRALIHKETSSHTTRMSPSQLTCSKVWMTRISLRRFDDYGCATDSANTDTLLCCVPTNF
jgi:N utilization substance protein A